MSRHRTVRSKNFSDEYDGLEDCYGHSVEDDYCISPSAEQFMYDRTKQANIASFMTEPDIVEDIEEVEDMPSSYKVPHLSDIDAAKLMSCVETIKNVIGDTYPESELNRKIIEFKFSTEAVLESILNDESSKNITEKQPLEKTFDIQPGLKATVPKVVSVPTVKVIPAASKSIIKGFDICATDSDLLTTPRSQSPSSNRTSPDPAAGDRRQASALVRMLNSNEKLNTSRSQSPAASEDAEPRVKSAEEKRDALAIYKSKREGCKENLHLICVGHVDAGKSTLLGRMLCDLGQVPSKLIHKYQQESKKIGKQSFAYAWVLDETGEERERGITMDVGHSKFETTTKSITLLDAPGHKDFIPNMITGATQADVALLVVDATRGEFETGFDSGGQTREHALLLRSLGVSQLAVVVNKLDTVDWSKERFNEIVNKLSTFLKQAGFRDIVTFVPCSGLSGENIVMKPKAEGLSSWYTGLTLVEVIDSFKCPERPVDRPFRFSVNDIFKNTGSGFSVSGHMETGMISVSDKVLVLPLNETAVIKGIQIDEMNVTHSFAGDQVSLILSGIDQQKLAIGDIVCTPHHPVPVTSCFQVHVVIFAVKMPLTNGMPVVLHQQSLVEPVIISKLIVELNRSTGEVIKKKPRCLMKNSSAIIEITTQRPICVELHKDVKQLGRVMLRIDGTTIAAGLITKIKN
ncbi:protein HBS1 isoform X2 [Phymastichus coffea]|uniref:protein HBS1 isoform X2 n=1 Tax=Phymastichus coffea TaxID=108790 RepID=UPI00273CE252|nr:protein HBS1 isoform X2 [Phymastichus coffea]